MTMKRLLILLLLLLSLAIPGRAALIPTPTIPVYGSYTDANGILWSNIFMTDLIVGAQYGSNVVLPGQGVDGGVMWYNGGGNGTNNPYWHTNMVLLTDQGLYYWGLNGGSAQNVYSYGGVYGSQLMTNIQFNVSLYLPTLDTATVTRNYADSTAPLTVQIANASSTANIAVFKNQSSTEVSMDRNGNVSALGSFYGYGISTSDNRGAAPTSITVSGSPFSWTNNTGLVVIVYIVQGSVSQTAINGTSIGSGSPGIVILQPSEYVTVTYSAAPTMTYKGL